MKTFVTPLFIIVLVSFSWNAAPVRAQGLTESNGPEIDALLSQLLASIQPLVPVSAIVTYDHMPTSTDLNSLTSLGLSYHTYNMLPMAWVTGLPASIQGCTSLAGVVSVWANRTVGLLGDVSRAQIGADQVANTLGITGRGIGVAIVDTGIDATHPDLTFGSVVTENIKFTTVGSTVITSNSMAQTEVLSGHGTFCAGLVAGRGTASGGKYIGIAPGAHLIGLAVGSLGAIVSALDAYNWILNNHAAYNIKVVSNSWGTTGSYSPNDPVNVATKALTDAGISVVFSAGNGGPGASTINPYAVAPWVIGVGAANRDGVTLATFSGRGVPGDSTAHPTITAPGVQVTSCRSVLGLVANALGALYDLTCTSILDLLNYGCNVGTSVSAPHVSGTLALMLEANPALTPTQLKNLIIQSATPMPGYQQYEVGAGFLNALNAVQLARGQ